MDICNSFIGFCKFLGVFPIQYDSRNKELAFRKARFFLTRNILFAIITFFSIITKFVRFSTLETNWNEDYKSLLMKTYGVFNLNFILYLNKILTVLSFAVPLINFSFRETVGILNTCARDTFPCRKVTSRLMLMKWLLLPGMIIANIQDIAFEMYQVFIHWSVPQLFDSFASLLRTISGLTIFFATMFLFVCMYNIKEKIRNIRDDLENISSVLEKKQSFERTIFLPAVECVPVHSTGVLFHNRRNLLSMHLKLKLLRRQHNNLIFCTQSLNKRFQTDVFFIVVITFYLLLMCTYGFVFNIVNFDEGKENDLIKFFSLLLFITVYRLFLCWLICYGASTIADESELLKMAIMRLSILNIKDKYTNLEVQLFHLQCKNREDPFNIFGMFAVGKSFMFMMLTTIISYIAVIIQFTYEEQTEFKAISMLNKTLATTEG